MMLKHLGCLVAVLVGVSLAAETVTTNDGKVYKNATILSVTPVGFDICYSPKKGSTVIKELLFTNLPEKYRQRYNYNPQRADAFMQKVKEYRAKQEKDLAVAYRQRLAAAQENDHVQAVIYSERLNIILNPIRPITGGTIAYIDDIEATPTSGHYGKGVIMGVELAQSADWGGTIYPTGTTSDTAEGTLPVYCTTLDQAVVVAQQHFQVADADQP